jgi:hypothetical protein
VSNTTSNAWAGSAPLARHFELEAGGYSVTHLPPSALRDGAAFIRLVQDWLKARRASLGL